jgi:cytochrome bd-type quinol oxidase subunit 2
MQMKVIFGVGLGIVQLLLTVGLPLTAVGLSFGGTEAKAWTDPIYYAVFLPTILSVISLMHFAVYLHNIVVSKGAKMPEMSWASIAFWSFTLASIVYGFIAGVIVLVACQSNVVCDPTIPCDNNSAIAPYTGPRPRYLALFSMTILMLVSVVGIILLSLSGFRSSNGYVKVSNKSNMPVASKTS